MIVLDTHIWLWWINQDHAQLPERHRLLIEGAEVVVVSAISCFEIAWLAHHGRLALNCAAEDWLGKALSGSGIGLLPITPNIACRAVQLPEHHKDPHDRLIIATALITQSQLLSLDGHFKQYRELDGLLV